MPALPVIAWLPWLRRKLKDARIRPNLVRSDRTGNVELFLAEGDEVEDKT